MERRSIHKKTIEEERECIAMKMRGQMERECEEAKNRSIMEKEKEFKNFDIYTDPPGDHHYINKCKKGTSTKSRYDSTTLRSNQAAKEIQKNWKVLKTSLPDSIYVRVYETRIDLMRAVIIGPDDTPYSNGLFFFDIYFPKNYPNVPPKVHYCSYGFDLNPNLYPSGKVCLSIINTWTGRKEERWNPYQSTILQVLVSIQGLVLNSTPYYNEPQRLYIFEGKFSVKYSECVYTRTCNAMIFTLRKPPQQFGLFVAGHFRRQARQILMNCKANMNSNNCTSVCQLVFLLAKGFEANGAFCEDLVDEVQREKEVLMEKSKNCWFVWKIWNTLKRSWDSLFELQS